MRFIEKLLAIHHRVAKARELAEDVAREVQAVREWCLAESFVESFTHGENQILARMCEGDERPIDAAYRVGGLMLAGEGDYLPGFADEVRNAQERLFGISTPEEPAVDDPKAN